jgi:peptidoglycan/xylan/chitin deacetylase (PgdA/CDA1 family)/GT2 family glycosyltransferase
MKRVSIVVPAYNEERLLPLCLDALLAQDYPGAIEIIVVNNGSTDRTAEVAQRPGVIVLHEPQPGYRAALVRGFAAATGEIIACTDADTRVPRHWVSRLVREYEVHPQVVCVGGTVDFGDPNWKGALVTRVILPLVNQVDRRDPRGPHLWGANFSVRREAFLRAGGWNEAFELQADTELSERLHDFGRVVLIEDLSVRSSSRRWNREPIASMLLFGTNFVWFKLFRRPLYRSFPPVREHLDAVRAGAGLWSPGRGLAASGLLLLLGVTFAGWLAVAPQSSAFGKTYWHGATTRRVVALTFDDGPNDPYTSQILDILKREHVRATFFLIGENVRRFPRTAARIAREGHAIGNHSDHHVDDLALKPVARQRVEVERAEQAIHAATGLYPRLFRPPHGLRSPWLIHTLARDSMVVVTWNEAPGDWNRMTVGRLIEATLREAHQGSIILLHDGMNLEHGADQSQTVRALPGIIQGLKARGLGFVTVPELLKQPAYLSSGEKGTTRPSPAPPLHARELPDVHSMGPTAANPAESLATLLSMNGRVPRRGPRSR